MGNELNLHRVLLKRTEANRLIGWLREYRLAMQLAEELRNTSGANTKIRPIRSESAQSEDGRQ
jgi:hypothetical protein